MSWLLSIFIGLLAAVVGCLGAGVVAGLCVDWHRISSFEGVSGYFYTYMHEWTGTPPLPTGPEPRGGG
jgi:hypothetical protein